ncbi:hypothetical protein K7X08_005785 [Anisodus acutangulus]|uniref:t-SNARE coiled-coil homology domain-containing protein n=1 Tax=Anisodus acutangulus TaxID=402998 RepID=A0A9Q1LW42_9SOLA|nr:hypothetical protein K7X08_005785 [Anisodus acutangulus]
MATRNRSRLFKSYRDTLNKNRIPFTSSKDFGGSVIELGTTSFLLGEYDTLATIIQQADPLPSFNKARSQLLLEETRRAKQDEHAQQVLARSLATDLQNLSVELRRMQSLYLKQLQQQSEGHDGLDLEMNEKKSSFLDDDFNDVGFTDLQMATGQRDEQFTAEIEREIKQVLKSVNELSQIMKDLSVLVIDQGTIVDRIDHNVQSVSASVEEGFKQLQKAQRSQRKGGMGCSSLDAKNVVCYTYCLLGSFLEEVY